MTAFRLDARVEWWGIMTVNVFICVFFVVVVVWFHCVCFKQLFFVFVFYHDLFCVCVFIVIVLFVCFYHDCSVCMFIFYVILCQCVMFYMLFRSWLCCLHFYCIVYGITLFVFIILFVFSHVISLLCYMFYHIIYVILLCEVCFHFADYIFDIKIHISIIIQAYLHRL